MTIQIQNEGRRFYLIGNTYPIKDAIKNAGCKWDSDRGAWWTSKKDVAESLVSDVGSGKIVAKASFAKLADGTWGIKVAGVPAHGARIVVDGKYGEKTVTVDAVISTTDGMSICSTINEPKKPRQQLGPNGTARARGGYRAPRHGGQCRGHGCCAPAAPGCAGYCKQCHFDEYDG